MAENDYISEILKLAEAHKFDAEALYAKIVRSLNQRLIEHSPVPDILYHYTNSAGLFGIIKSQSFWASHFEYLNDTEEIVLLTTAAHTYIDEHLKLTNKAGKNNLISDCPENLRINLLSIWRGDGNLTDQYAPYISSLSAHGDLLGQWRTYGDNGHGYCIGFRVEELRKLVSQQCLPAFIWPVSYDKKTWADLAELIIEAVIGEIYEPFFATKSGYVTNEALRVAFDCVHRLFALTAPVCKHDAFSEEREWRIVADGVRLEAILAPMRQTSFPNSPLVARPSDALDNYDVRLSSRQFIPFVRLAFGDIGNLIESITVGPCEAGPPPEVPLRLLLKKGNLNPDIPIKRSSLPYRTY